MKKKKLWKKEKINLDEQNKEKHPIQKIEEGIKNLSKLMKINIIFIIFFNILIIIILIIIILLKK